MLRHVGGRAGEYRRERRSGVHILVRMALRGMERLLAEGGARGYDKIGVHRCVCRIREGGRRGR